MIVTRRGLEEFVDLRGIMSSEILDKLSSIGLEVESYKRIDIPKGVVVGKIKECSKHPDANKLSLCVVDVGGEELTIVCGAPNVAANQLVAVAKIGSTLPNGLKIKKAKLRGVESSGMICSSSELGLPEINDGIMELDSSIGTFKVGDELSLIEELNDEIIELGITPNRGDCFSLYGVARDISCAFSREIRPIEYKERKESVLGIGRTLSIGVEHKLESSLLYRMIEIKKKATTPLKIALRLAYNGTLKKSAMDNFVEYATYVSGVVMNCYSESELNYDSGDHKKFHLDIKKDEHSLDALYGKERLSSVGYERVSKEGVGDGGIFVIEASYVAPELISKKVTDAKLKKGSNIYFRASRGSNPDLSMGMDELLSLIHCYTDSTIYSGVHEYRAQIEPRTISVDRKKISYIIGKEYATNEITDTLKALHFSIEGSVDSDTSVIKVPIFRHDIVTIQDIAEEVLRFDGIDELKSSALEFKEKFRGGQGVFDYKKRDYYRKRAAISGFSEAVHYIFTSLELEEAFGFKPQEESLKLSNPITNELNTLRSSLIPNMVESAKRNANFGQKSISLFEIGRVFDSERNESERVAFLFSGDMDKEAFPHPKGEPIDFFSFATLVSKATLPFRLQEPDRAIPYLHPYMGATVLFQDREIGYIGRLHPALEGRFELEQTFVCEIEFSKLSFESVVVKSFSNIQPLHRDISFLVDKDMRFEDVAKLIEPSIDPLVQSYYPLDLYGGSELEGKKSLTIRFIIQPDERSLEDEEIATIISRIVEVAKKEGIELR